MKGKFRMNKESQNERGELPRQRLPPLGIVCYIFRPSHSVRRVLFHLPGIYGAVQIL